MSRIIITTLILGFIASFVYSLFYTPPGGAHLQRAENDLKALEACINQYHKTTGTIPTSEQGLYAFVERPASLPDDTPWTPLLKEVPEDPWGNPYIYQAFPDETPMRAQIISIGPDDTLGTEDDLISEQTFPATAEPSNL